MMRSSGSVLWPTAISVASIWCVEVPVAWVLSHGPLGLRGVWIAYPITFVVSLALQSAYYFLVWRRQPIRALHASPIADAEGIDETASPAALASSAAPASPFVIPGPSTTLRTGSVEGPPQASPVAAVPRPARDDRRPS